MKTNIHPNWHHDCVVTCSCGSSFAIGSTEETLQVDICNACHPFFTGEMKFVDRQGRVDRFKQKMQKAQNITQKKKKNKSAQDDNSDEHKSYRQILREQQSELRQAKKSADKAFVAG